MAKDTGSARNLPAGRLSSFENDDTVDLSSLLPRRAAQTADEPTPPRKAKPAPPAPAPVAEVPADVPPTASGGGEERPARRPSANAAPNRIRASSVQIPASLIDRITQEREAQGLSNGEIVIDAIERAEARLPELVHPRGRIGHGLFAQRATRGARAVDGPLTALNIRLRESDYEVIDNLVDKLGAYSRGHLVSVALIAYFDS